VLTVIAHYQAKPGEGDAVAAALREVAIQSREEPGCLLYTVHRARDDNDAFVLFEQYLDEADLDAHRETPHFQRIVVDRVIPLLASRDVKLYVPIVD
jgi:(4S)-4-hydroxy-5-phosphonooxypentane-2,3-dione isomerase